MYSLLTVVAVGISFIFLGRWIYRDPKKLYPAWLYSNPDHYLLLGFARAFATLAIFVGSSAAIGTVVSQISPGIAATLLMLVGGVSSAYFLRPKVERMADSLPTNLEPVHRNFLTSKGKWLLVGSIPTAAVFVVVLIASVGNSDVCKAAVNQAQFNTTVIEQLGQPVERGFLVSGNIEITGPSGHADIAIPLSGPKGKGTLYAVGVEEAGIWRFETLQLAIDGRTQRLDLLNGNSKKIR